MKDAHYLLYLHHGTRLSGKVDIENIIASQEGGTARGWCSKLSLIGTLSTPAIASAFHVVLQGDGR